MAKEYAILIRCNTEAALENLREYIETIEEENISLERDLSYDSIIINDQPYWIYAWNALYSMPDGVV